MANQKVYNIVINGIKESISEVDVLLNQLDNLEKRLKNLGKEGIKLDTKGLKDLEKIKIPEISLEGIDAKALKKEMQQLEKDIAKGAKTIDGEYTNTLNGLRAKLRDLKAELGTVDIDVDADVFADLTDEIKELNDQVKQMEQDYGTFSRNVGNYTDSMVDALNEFDGQMYETAGAIEEVKEGVDSLKGKQLFDVNIGGVAVQFENVSQAIGEIDDMAHSAAAKMQELRNAGKENTEEYKKLNQEFQEFIQTSANLERVRKQTDELRDSVASTSRGLDMGVQAFQALGNAMQMASGIAGLFGDNQEEIEKAINRTVQIQAILQAATELYNFTQNNAIKNSKLYALTIGKLGTAYNALIAKIGLGTKATKLFNATLKANIFVAIASAILYVASNLDKLSEILGLTNEDTKLFTDLWNKISPVIMGVGKAVTDFLINPLRTLIKIFANITEGNWKGAFDELKKGFKEQFNVIEDYQKGYADEVENQAERATKKQKIELDKQLLNDIKYNEAKYGSDWKYTKKGIELYRQYFANKLSMYNKDTDEYREALIEQLNFERELKEHFKTNSTENAKSQADIKREIIDAEIAAMKDGFKKEQALLLEQQRRELEDAANNKKLKTALEKKHQKELEDLFKEHSDNLIKYRKDLSNELFKIDNETNALNENNLLKKSEYELDVYDKKLESKRYNSSNTKDIKNLVFNYGGFESLEEKINAFKTTNDTLIRLQEQYAQDAEFIAKQMNETESDAHRKHYEGLLKTTKDNNKHFEKIAIDYNGHYIGIINQRIVAERNIETLNYREQLVELNKWFEEKFKAEKDNEKKTLELVGDDGDARMKIMEQSNEVLIQIEKEYEDKKLALLIDYMNKNQLIEINANKERSNIVSKYNDIVYNEYRKHYDQLNQLREEYSNIDEVNLPTELSSIGSFTTQILEMNKFKDEYKKTIENIAKQKAELQKQFEDGVISADAYSKQMNELQVFEKETKDVLNNISMSWKDWAVGLAQVTNAVVGMWAQMYSQIADLQYQNEMHRIEKLQEDYDDETETLREALEEQEELFEKHNQNVNDIEGELETARGDRRLFLLDQINAEMMKREQAWAQQQKIQKQQEQLQKKKDALEDRQKAAEQKRNKQNQKVQIAQATASTALAVTNALAVQPWFLGVALAAVAAAMGAVQIATIAKQKFADGGVIQGKSHSQGGVPVMNGSVEVEGGEYITNKVTTSKNVDVLTFINSKKKKLDLSDFVEFYSNGSNKNYSKPFKTVFADGGTLPSMNAPMIDTRAINSVRSEDNRPIYVSVTEIENVQNKVRNVRAIAGIEN